MRDPKWGLKQGERAEYMGRFNKHAVKFVKGLNSRSSSKFDGRWFNAKG